MVGQEPALRKLKRTVQVHKMSGITPSHTLMIGPSGAGKTTAANAFANDLDWKLARLDSGVNRFDIRMFLCDLEPNSVLFIDEAQELSRKCQELLLTAAEEWTVTISVAGELPETVSLPPFIMVLATTNPERIVKPLKNRCRTICEFFLFSLDEMKQIVARAARLYGLKISKAGIAVIAEASCCTARDAEQLLQGVRDFAIVEGTNGKILSKAFVQKCLQSDGIDPKGLRPTDRKLLEVYAEAHPQSVQLQTAASVLDLQPNTVRCEHEQKLRRLGFIVIGKASGRLITKAGLRHIWQDGK
jgi:holliday junction DNA helicase RuvB